MTPLRVVLAGCESPLRDVLRAWERFSRLHCAAVFTDLQRHARDVARWLGPDVPVESLEQLGTTSGAARLSTVRCDWLVSIGSTVLYPPEVLHAPALGGLNMHPGRLPDYAGLHVHQWAIRNGESTFGATIHWLDHRIDTGDIVVQSTFALRGDESGLQLYRRCLRSGTELMLEVLARIDAGRSLPRRPQDPARYRIYRTRDARHGTIDWTRPAVEVERFIRAADYVPFQSPTYTPETHCGDLGFRIRRAVLVDEVASVAPGGIVRADEEGLVIACGDRRTVRATWIEDEEGKRIAIGGPEAGRFELVPGRRFGPVAKATPRIASGEAA